MICGLLPMEGSCLPWWWPAIGVDSHAEIWVMPYPVGIPRKVPLQVILSQSPNTSVSWTIDNRHLVFSYESVSGGGTHVYRAGYRHWRGPACYGRYRRGSDPAVSPDGRRIAFASGDYEYDLIVASLDGSRTSPLLCHVAPTVQRVLVALRPAVRLCKQRRRHLWNLAAQCCGKLGQGRL